MHGPMNINDWFSFYVLQTPRNSGLSLLQARIQVETVHDVGRTATTHVILLLLSLWSDREGKKAGSCLKVAATGFNPLQGHGIRKRRSLGRNWTTCRETDV